MPYYVFPWKSLIQFGAIKKKIQATYKLHDAFFTSDQWKTIFDKVAFKTLHMYLETSLFSPICRPLKWKTLYGIGSHFSLKIQISTSCLNLRGASWAQQGLVQRTDPNQHFKNINPILLRNNPFNPWEYQKRQKSDSTDKKKQELLLLVEDRYKVHV